MFELTWGIVVLLAAGPQLLAVTEGKPFQSRAACVQAIKDHELRMPDMVRGHFNLDWSVVIKVSGTCAPKGDPT